MASFIMCLADRINRQTSLKGFSCCDHCQKQLSWIALLPILGWLTSAGRCRHCHCRIPIRYPILEACCGTAFVLLANQINWLAFICLLLFLSCEDLYDQRAHAAILYPMIGFELVSQWQLETIMALLAIMLFASFFIYYRKAMGSGDLPLLLLLYLMMAPIAFAAVILLASILAIACCCWQKIKIVPLIPFLSISAVFIKLFVYL